MVEREPFSLATGAVVAGRFRLERPLGEGGMGVVWAAQHLVTRKPVALKFLKTDGHGTVVTRQRFLREARAASAVRHPSVVQVHDVLELEDGSPVMVMDLLEGETLTAKLERERPLPLGEVARVMVPVCAAVGAAHALGIVHRDLKPDNIFLAREHDGTVVKVLDFGIAKLTATEGDAAQTGPATNTGTFLGTPFYMAPEQLFAERDVDFRADLWALGVILYEALAGERPTGDNLGQILKTIAKGGIVPLEERAPSVPAPVLQLVARLLEHERDRRPAGLREVIDVLSQYTSAVAAPFEAPVSSGARRDASPIAATSNTPGPVVTASRRPRRWTLAALLVAVAGVAVGGASLLGRRSVSDLPPSAAASTTAPIVVAPPPPPVPSVVVPSSSALVAPPVPSVPSTPLATTRQGRPSAIPKPSSSASTTSPTPKPSATTPRMSEDL